MVQTNSSCYEHVMIGIALIINVDPKVLPVIVTCQLDDHFVFIPEHQVKVPFVVFGVP